MSSSQENSLPLISVVIPTRNRPEDLKRAIRSVSEQTYLNLEIIVIDDGTDDATSPSEESLRKSLVREIPLTVEKNTAAAHGASAARNQGLARAQGELIAFLDDDDSWMPQKLEKQALEFERNPSLSLVSTDYIEDDHQGSRTTVSRAPNNEIGIDKALLMHNVIGGCSLPLMRTEAVRGVGGFDPALRSCQDWDLWLRLVRHSRAYIVPQALVIISTSPGERISTNLRNRVNGYFRFIEKHKESFTPPVRFFHLLRLAQMGVVGIPPLYRFTVLAGKPLRGLLKTLFNVKYSNDQAKSRTRK